MLNSSNSLKIETTSLVTTIQLHQEGYKVQFSLEEAQQLLPIIFRLTKKYQEQVDSLMKRLQLLTHENSEAEARLEKQINQLIQEWQTKMSKLGAVPKGLWLLDFDSGDGYYCWKFPERQIEFWHGYADGFSKRVGIDERYAPHLSHS